MAMIKTEATAEDITDCILDTESFDTKQQVDLLLVVIDSMANWFGEVEHRDHYHKGMDDAYANVELAHRRYLRERVAKLLRDGRDPREKD